MGGGFSQAVEQERVNWAVPHSLAIDPNLGASQQALVQNFGQKLFLALAPRKVSGIEYFHYFVTDRCWTIEFGGGEITECTVKVHNNPMCGYHDELRFTKSPDVVRRMLAVCGARGYSLCLRNCEHLARYIASGSWVSAQMLPQGRIRKAFIEALMDKDKVKINTLPAELEEEFEVVALFPNETPFINYSGSPSGLSKADESAFNVLVLGPTGCGKSHLINLMFNQTVCPSAGTASSVTRHLRILSGEATFGTRREKVNVIDTVGICDSALSAAEVLALVKEHLKVNFAYLDRVLIVCSGRIEAIHTEQIKQYLQWLNMEQHPLRFTFIYNKADLQSPHLRQSNLFTMCEKLEGGHGQLKYHAEALLPSFVMGGEEHAGPLVVSNNFATGFPPQASYEEIRPDLFALLDRTFVVITGSRIPVQESWCTLL